MQRAAVSRRRLVTVDDDRVDRVDADIGLGLVVYVVDARDPGFAGRSLDARIAQGDDAYISLGLGRADLARPGVARHGQPVLHIGIDSAYEGRFDASRQHHRGECKSEKFFHAIWFYRHSGISPSQGSAACS